MVFTGYMGSLWAVCFRGGFFVNTTITKTGQNIPSLEASGRLAAAPPGFAGQGSVQGGWCGPEQYCV